jgi:hypothetical protein
MIKTADFIHTDQYQRIKIKKCSGYNSLFSVIDSVFALKYTSIRIILRKFKDLSQKSRPAIIVFYFFISHLCQRRV